jgi:hypothetical protein
VRPGGDLPVGRFVDRAVESFFGFSERYFCSHLTQITSRTFRIPPHQRGVSRSSRTRGAEAVDAAAFCAQRDRRAGDEPVSDHQASGREMLQRTAKSCGPDAPTLASSLRSCVGPTGLRQNLIRRRRWQKRPVTGESAKETVKTIACGNAGCFRCTRILVCFLPNAKRTRGRGCNGHPAFPTPSFGREINARLGRIAPRGREVMFAFGARTRDACPGCCAARRSSRRGALLIRGPFCTPRCLGSRLCGAA